MDAGGWPRDGGFVASLQPDECWALLRSTDVGRLAFVLNGRLEIFPVNYVVHDGAVLFRTSGGSKLSAVRVHATVVFEVDGLEGVDDVDGSAAWSVIVRGRVREVTNVRDPVELARLPLRPLARGDRPNVVELAPVEITGRRFSAVDRMLDLDAAPSALLEARQQRQRGQRR